MNTYRWQDIHLGLSHTFEAAFTAQMVADFAHLSGDHNPLHVDAAYAAAAGFPHPVLFGMMTSTLYSRLAGMYLPGKYALLQGIELTFHTPCFVGESLTVTGEVTHLTEAFRRFEVKASIRRTSDRKLISKANIQVGFHAE